MVQIVIGVFTNDLVEKCFLVVLTAGSEEFMDLLL